MRGLKIQGLNVSKQVGAAKTWADVMLCKDGRYHPVIRYSRRDGREGGCRLAGISSDSCQVALERSWLALHLSTATGEQRDVLKG